MKKMRFLCVSVLALGLAFIATSCNKDKETTSINVSTCALEEEDDDARVYIDFGDRNRMKWNADDRIMVYNLLPGDGGAAIVQEFHTDEAAEGMVEATFHGPNVGAPQSDLGFFFFYPAEMASNTVDAENRATFTVGDEQFYTELDDANGVHITTIQPGTMAQAATSQDLTFTMNNMFGVARIYLVGNKEVARVEIEDSQLNLTGSVDVCLPNVDAATMLAYVQAYKNGAISYEDMYEYLSGTLLYMPHPVGKTVALDCENYVYNGQEFPGVQLTNPDAKSFMLCLRPGALSKGFTVTVYFTDGTAVFNDMYANTDNLQNPRKYCIVPNRIQGIHFRDADGFDIPVEEWPELLPEE